jgi:geranylgeranyl diphosphate synthase type II
MVTVAQRIETALEAVVARGEAAAGPQRLAAAIRHAVFPGGARIRPQLTLAVALGCGDDLPGVTDTAAAAIELLHCASLVHDDLPCFDDADTRRGRPSVHAAFGERLAVLAGDALIVMAFQALGATAGQSPERAARVLDLVSRGVGPPFGIVAGQAWECESSLVIRDYQRAKTGALFAAATMAGAAAAGCDPGPWRAFGEWLGEAYQVADDLRDLLGDAHEIGKPVGRDLALGRPNVARDAGVGPALARFESLVSQCADSIPACQGATHLRALVHRESARLVPPAWIEASALLVA